MRKFGLIGSAIAILALPAIALAANPWDGNPIVGLPGNTACLSFGNNGVCNQFIPQGPDSETGAEVIPGATGSSGGANPQTVLIPTALIGFNNRVNRLIGGDFNTNLWQRGTTFSSLTPTTTTMTADRFGVYSSANTVTVTKQTGTSDTIPALGFYASARVNRPSGTNTSQICMGQVLDKQAAAPLIGNNAIFSFYALAGAGLSAVTSGNNISVNIAYYTAADSATPGTNTDAFMKGTITGYTAAVGGGSIPSLASTVSVASGVATFPISSTTWTRYAVWAKIPATSAGTPVTGVGVSICYTPASGTGGSTEWFEFTGAQLNANSSIVTTNWPNGVTAVTAFERRSVQVEALYQQYYTQGLGTEVNGQYYTNATTCTASGNVNIGVNFNTPMRIAPTGATSTLTAGGYSIKTAAAATGVGTLTIAAANIYGLTLNSNAACTTTLPYVVVGTNTTGLILFSAEP